MGGFAAHTNTFFPCFSFPRCQYLASVVSCNLMRRLDVNANLGYCGDREDEDEGLVDYSREFFFGHSIAGVGATYSYTKKEKRKGGHPNGNLSCGSTD